MTTDSCDDSRLCAELQGEVSGIAFHELCRGDPPTRCLHETEHFAVLVDLAPLTEGHLLIVPKGHLLRFGQVAPELWPELETVLAQTVAVVESEYGSPLILEHGSSTSMESSACVSHAHWHVVPAEVDLRPTMASDGLEGGRFGSLRDLTRLGAADQAYILVGHPSTGENWLYLSGLSSRHQYLRWVLAQHLGIPDPEWDWGHTQRLDLLRATYDRLTGAWS